MSSLAWLPLLLRLMAPPEADASETPPETSPQETSPQEASAPETLAWGETVVVTASRVEELEAEVPAHVTVLDRETLERSPAATVDGALAQVAGFQLFRRGSSLVAHPTTQGPSLRGVGSSAASRALVLLDGVPLNDPFGGWVAWSKVPLAGLERIEVVRGGGSHLWGSHALAGVVQLLTADPAPATLELSVAGGNRGEGRLDARASDVWGEVGLSLLASAFETGGYVPVRRDQRGAIDVEARARHAVADARAVWTPGPAARLTFRARAFDEERGNGTPLTGNATESLHLATTAAIGDLDRGRFEAVLAAEDQSFASTFSAQEEDRSSERPALDQHDVAARSLTAGASWARQLAPAHRLSAGGDLRFVEGATHEDFFFSGGGFLRRRRAGGEQRFVGAWAQEVFTLSRRWQLTAGVRVDRWRDSGGGRTEIDLVSGETLLDETFAARSRSAWSPRVGARFEATPSLGLYAAAYRSFRAPTLNELYRPFRVRNDITAASAELDAERLEGAEVGLDLRRGASRARLTAFWNEIDGPITNLTLAPGPGFVAPCGFVPAGGVCRQRRNLGRSRSRGLEAELSARLAPRWELRASGLWVDARVLDAAGEPALAGRRLPQVPEHGLAAGLGYARPDRFAAWLQVRRSGPQHEDDRNQRELGGFTVVDLSLSRPLRPGWELFAAAENVLDRTYEVGETADGLVSVGEPARVRIGLRFGTF